MKAVLLQGYGGVDQLEYTDMPDPSPQPGEALVRVFATSLNPIDFKLRRGAMKAIVPLNFPAILGRDIAGQVVGLGPGVSHCKVGDRVIGIGSHTYAEYVACQPEALTQIPEGLDPVDAGALPLVTLTGAQLIERGVQPKGDETLLVTGAFGSVGRSAVYVAKQHGCRVIAGVKASQKSDARALGADGIVALDDDADLGSLPELDAIADTIDGPTVGKLAPKLKKSGIFASVLGRPEAAQKAGFDIRPVVVQPDPLRLHKLAIDLRDGKFSIPIAKRLPLKDIREAHSEAEKGMNGKILLLP